MKPLLSNRDAAAYIGVAPKTLHNWRARGEGPAFIKTPGKTGKVLYDPDDIAAWRKQRTFSSVKEAFIADDAA